MTEIQRWNKKMATRRAQRVMGGLFFVPPAKKMAAHREVVNRPILCGQYKKEACKG